MNLQRYNRLRKNPIIFKFSFYVESQSTYKRFTGPPPLTSSCKYFDKYLLFLFKARLSKFKKKTKKNTRARFFKRGHLNW